MNNNPREEAMEPIVVTVHSFVDLITNSSTEIYINANQGTITTTKKIINAILVAAGSKKTADDLFDIKLETVAYRNGDWDEKVPVEDDGAEYEEEQTNMIIAPKPGVKINEDIVGLMKSAFDIDAEYNG